MDLVASYHLPDAREEMSAVGLSPPPPLVPGRLFHGGPEVSACPTLSVRPSVLPAPGLSSASEQREVREATEEQRAGTGMETKPRALGGLHLHRARAWAAGGGLVEVRILGAPKNLSCF